MTGSTVWIASYPKSGSTWLRAVATALRLRRAPGLDELDGGTMTASRAVLDAATGVASSCMTADEIDLVRPGVDELLATEGRRGESRLRKVHDAFVVGPAGAPVVSVAATRGAIYMVRDPRDVVVSYAHHAGRSHAWAVQHLGDPAAAMAASPGGLHHQVRQRLATWSSHVTSWVDAAPFPVHVLRYEDCAAAPVDSFAGALRFAGLEASEQTVATAVGHASFERLRAAEVASGFRERPSTVGSFFRRGESGAWRDELSPELAARVEADHGDVMARLGYVTQRRELLDMPR
ncbi:MAG: hypothetical protein AVDCRST_MAG85-246 [uncultured Solirubrobacteraceae bacterium]|uniref:Sulfotransferase domain-containing protein n=1 Tax=uncultured Solirubrobacteraceae bacterium TaxID=1162706 RepID=A0A6J4RQP3_9ACTN|nr:MAG: hypothetical protein AVDCRST_MAG85-246 [uncultured Solirubrobacteraceae bacterium]